MHERISNQTLEKILKEQKKKKKRHSLLHGHLYQISGAFFALDGLLSIYIIVEVSTTSHPLGAEIFINLIHSVPHFGH
jgi:hypothetical protein